MWVIRDAKNNERGHFDSERAAWMEYERLAEIAGCLGPYSVKFEG
jgi:hypothetical protein